MPRFFYAVSAASLTDKINHLCLQLWYNMDTRGDNMIFRIFKDDIRSIFRHFLVPILVLGVIILPALYAWVNIYACHDPYVNTGKIPVAVASNDPGAHLTDGTYMNAAADVTRELRDNHDIGWCFPDTAADAIEGVRSGKYYAAIVFEDNFTYNMLNLQEALKSDEPSMTYYTNEKKNAIAAKITDAVAGSLHDRINTEYLEAVFDNVFETTNKLSDKLDGEEATAEALKQLQEARNAISDFNASVSLLASSNDSVKKTLSKAEKNLNKARSKADSNLAKAEASIDEAKATLKKLKSSLDQQIAALDDAIKELDSAIDALINAATEEEIHEKAEEVEKDAKAVLAVLKEIRSLIPDSSQSYAARIVCDTLDLMILQTEEIINLVEEDPAGNAEAIAKAVEALGNLGTSDLKPAVDSLISDFERAIRVAKPLLSATNGMLDNIDPVLDSAGGTVNGLDSTYGRLQVVLTSLQEDLDDIIAQVEAADQDDRLDLLTELMGGNPDEYSKFFSSLVHVNKNEVYSIRNYGAAMSPFYSILAIWVGGVILIGLFKTNVNRRKFPQITEAEGFFGRFLIFALIGQLQAAVIVAGDIFLFDCCPVHPLLMWVSAAVTSLVFVLLIYAMVVSFGIVGKAAVVVIMVLQIAGSSGSYPIEILPVIFDKIYRFFPFPYAINAMREALCGVYGNDFIIYLAQLLIFAAVAIIIGLFIRKPFIGVNRYMTEKLEETEVL